jgi:hypothetical protein
MWESWWISLDRILMHILRWWWMVEVWVLSSARSSSPVFVGDRDIDRASHFLMKLVTSITRTPPWVKSTYSCIYIYKDIKTWAFLVTLPWSSFDEMWKVKVPSAFPVNTLLLKDFGLLPKDLKMQDNWETRALTSWVLDLKRPLVGASRDISRACVWDPTKTRQHVPQPQPTSYMVSSQHRILEHSGAGQYGFFWQIPRGASRG